MHPCIAMGCESQVDDDSLMCERHWNMVPEALQREVWRTTTTYQKMKPETRDTVIGKAITSAMHRARQRAIMAVAHKEGKDV